MLFKKRVNKFLAFMLVLSLVMGIQIPVSAEEDTTGVIFHANDGVLQWIDLNGNSAIIQKAAGVSENTTEGKIMNLILDEDMDGVVDAGEEMIEYEGDALFDTSITVYGASGRNLNKGFCITMNSGTIEKICGSRRTVDGDIGIYINGGTVNVLDGFTGSSERITGKLTMIVSKTPGAVVNSYAVLNDEGRERKDYLHGGCFSNNKGHVDIYGDYTIDADVDWESLTFHRNRIMGSETNTLTIPSGVSVTVGSLDTAEYTDIVLKGSLNVTAGSEQNASLIAAGGTYSDNLTFRKFYYPLSIVSNVRNDAISITHNAKAVVEGNKTVYYLLTNSTIYIENAAVPTCECWYSTDGTNFAHYDSANNETFSVVIGEEPVILTLDYRPEPISVSFNGVMPQGYVGTTYTAEKPLCDLTTCEITGDTTEEYGDDVKYSVKSGSTLPAGLTISEGKIVGTPTVANTAGHDVTIVVTGRNSATDEINLTIKILPNPAGTETGTSGGQANAGGASGSTVQPSPKSKVGYTMSDKKSKAVYKVSSTDFEVTYVKPEKKTNKKITIPDTITYEGVTYKVTAIADNAFKNNKKLKTVKIGANIKSIGKSAFQSCTALKSLTVPASVESIGSKAFYGCKKLTKLTIKTDKLTTSNVGKNAFKKMGSSNYKKVKVKVPKKVLKAYKKTLVKRGLSKKAKIKK